MKIILAFGEERGVRYRPKTRETKALPAPVGTAASVEVLPAIAIPAAGATTASWVRSDAGERPVTDGTSYAYAEARDHAGNAAAALATLGLGLDMTAAIAA